MKKISLMSSCLVMIIIGSCIAAISPVNASWGYIVSEMNFAMSGSCMTSNGTYFCVRTEWPENGHVWKSEDGGTSWREVSSNLTGCFASRNARMYCTSNDTLIVGCGGKGKIGSISYSVDGGVPWKIAYTLEMDEGIWTFFEDRHENLYATVYSHEEPNTNTHAKLYKSTNNGLSWTLLKTFTGNRHCHDMFVNDYNGYIYVCVGDSGALYRSTDGGLTWYDIYPGLLFTSIIGRGDENTIWVGRDVWVKNQTDRTRIYKFSDPGTNSTVKLQTVWDYGSRYAGNVFWMADVHGALAFGTVSAESDLPWRIITGVSYDWKDFDIIRNDSIPSDWTGFYVPTRSFWPIGKTFIVDTAISSFTLVVEIPATSWVEDYSYGTWAQKDHLNFLSQPVTETCATWEHNFDYDRGSLYGWTISNMVWNGSFVESDKTKSNILQYTMQWQDCSTMHKDQIKVTVNYYWYQSGQNYYRHYNLKIYHGDDGSWTKVGEYTVKEEDGYDGFRCTSMEFYWNSTSSTWEYRVATEKRDSSTRVWSSVGTVTGTMNHASSYGAILTVRPYKVSSTDACWVSGEASTEIFDTTP